MLLFVGKPLAYPMFWMSTTSEKVLILSHAMSPDQLFQDIRQATYSCSLYVYLCNIRQLVYAASIANLLLLKNNNDYILCSIFSLSIICRL